MSSTKRKLDLWPLLITFGIAVFCTLLYSSKVPFLTILELKTFDLRLTSRSAVPVSNQVSIVAIDEESIEKIGRWPWSRETMSRLSRSIDNAKPKAVGYDISFFDPENTSAQKELLELAKNRSRLNLDVDKLKPYIKERMLLSNPDFALAKALSEAKSPQLLGYYFNFALDRKQEKPADMNTAVVYPGQKLIGESYPAKLDVPDAVRARVNIRLLAKAAGNQAYFNVFPDMDGTIRRYNLCVKFNEGYYQPLAGAMLDITNRQSLPMLEVAEHGIVRVDLGGKKIPVDKSGSMVLNFKGPAKTFKHYPAWKILEGKIDPKELQGKYLLVGVTAPAVFDLRVTPFGVAYPGIEIQATALENMLAEDFIVRPGWAPLFDLLMLWVLCFCCLLFLWKARPVWTLFGFLFFGVGYLWLNFYLLQEKGYWLNIVYPSAGFILTYISLNVYRFLFADRQKRAIRQAFSKYLDANVVDDVVRDPDKLQLGGEKLELSVLFSDIRSFTTISEGLAPEELVHLLNDYLTEMTRIVMENKGLLDKYIGDAVMAVYGAPRHYDEHALLACRTALQMTRRLEELNREWEPAGRPAMSIGVGVNTGSMVAGNMGSLERFDYTVMGDSVNLASRLEGLNKVYGTEVICSQFTYEQVRDHFWARSLDLVKVKGKDNAVEIFELIEDQSRPCPLSYLEQYSSALAQYREGKFEEALKDFKLLAEQFPEDKVLKLYQLRLERLHLDPPEKWDGVYIFTTK